MTAVNAVNEPSSLPPQVQSRFQLKPSRFSSGVATHFEGRDPTTGAPVLVRVLRDDAFGSAAERQRARRELQKLAQVRHDTLAGVIDSGEAGDITWYARELVEGETLAERILAKGALPAPLAAWVAMKVAAGLAELHRHGVQHRDLRPERVVLTREGTLKLLDAAVGRVTRLPDGRAVPGVPGYIAPEAITGRLVSFRSDLYALGSTLYEALAGRPTFPVADPARRVQLQTEGDPVALDASVPEALGRLAFTLLAREQRDRPFSAQQVERQLDPFAKAPEAAAPAADDFDIPDEGSRTMASDTSPAAPMAGTVNFDDDDRADDAPTRMHAPIDLPGSSTIVGMMSPVVPTLSPPMQVSQPPPVPQGSVGTGTMNTRLPKMPTLPPIPAGASRMSAPGPQSVAAAPPPPAGPSRKSTMMGMPMNDLPGAPPPPANIAPPVARAAPGKGPLDYDDLGDTTVNDDSRAFGLPGYVPSQGSAVPPLPGDAAQQVLGARAPGAGFPGATGAPGPALSTMQGVGNPSYDPAMSSTVMAPAPVGMMPMQGGSMQQGGMYPQQQSYNGGYPQGMHQQPQPGYPPGGMAPPRPSNSALPWVAGILSVVAFASVGGLVVAKLRTRDAPVPESVTIVPQISPTPAMPLVPSPTQEAAPTPQPVPPQVPVVAPTPAPTVAVAPHPPPAHVAPVANARTQPATPAPAPAHTQPAVVHTQPATQPAVTRTQPATQPAVARTQPATQPTVARTQPATQPAAIQPAAAPGGAVAANDPRIQDALRTRNYPTARTLLQGALRAQPNNAALHAQLGNVYERLGDRASALNEYRNATRIDRRNTQFMHRLVDLLVATNDRAGAIATLRQILTITPTDRAAQARLQALGAQ